MFEIEEMAEIFLVAREIKQIRWCIFFIHPVYILQDVPVFSQIDFSETIFLVQIWPPNLAENFKTKPRPILSVTIVMNLMVRMTMTVNAIKSVLTLIVASFVSFKRI